MRRCLILDFVAAMLAASCTAASNYLTTRLVDWVILLRLQQHENRAASQPHFLKGGKPLSDRIAATIFMVPQQRSRFDNACFCFMRDSPRSFGASHENVAQSEPDWNDLIHL
jgi:hypothetical protein